MPTRSLYAQGKIPDELCAAFLYNMAKFIRFPELENNQPSPMVIGVMGASSLLETLNRQIAGKSAQGRTLEIKAVEQSPDAGIGILFLEKDLDAITLEAFAKTGIVTVGQSDNFIQKGGGIRVYLRADRIRFEINRRATREAKVTVNASVLALADKVIE